MTLAFFFFDLILPVISPMTLSDLIPGYTFSVFLAIGIPLAVGVYLSEKKNVPWRVWGWGAVAWLVAILRLLPLYAWVYLSGIDFTQMGNAILQLVVFSLAAGVAEELLRWVVGYKVFREGGERDPSTIAMYGIGHGGIESIGLVGIPLLLTLGQIFSLEAQLNDPLLTSAQHDQVVAAIATFNALPAWIPYIAGVERIGAMLVHLSLAFWVERGIALRKRWVIAVTISLHFLLDLTTSMFLLYAGILWSEVALFIIVSVVLPLSLVISGHWGKRIQPSYNTH